jgi:hypothetical protein
MDSAHEDDGRGEATEMAQRGKTAAKVTCDDCYFSRNGLCSLSSEGPCPTFRPDRPEGLRPPRQMRFQFRQRSQAAWSFPTAQQQATLHA